MTQRADAHIHLFSGGYQDSSFASRPGVTIDEAACYHSLAVDCDVTAALVVGFGGEDWCVENNAYLAEQVGRYEWIRPLAYLTLDALLTVDELQRLQQQPLLQDQVNLQSFSEYIQSCDLVLGNLKV